MSDGVAGISWRLMVMEMPWLTPASKYSWNSMEWGMMDGAISLAGLQIGGVHSSFR